MKMFNRIASVIAASALVTAGLVAVSTPAAWADRPCTGRSKKLHIMNIEDDWFGDIKVVTVLNCHPTKRRATLDVARWPDPECKKIPFGETRKFTFIARYGISSLRGAKFC